jgi:hypothetical protein
VGEKADSWLVGVAYFIKGFYLLHDVKDLILSHFVFWLFTMYYLKLQSKSKIYKLRSKTIAFSWMFMLFIAYVEDNSTSCESKLYTILHIQNIRIHVWMQKRIMEIDIDVVYDINTKNL